MIFLKIQIRSHKKYEFQKVQEILEQIKKKVLRIPEENNITRFNMKACTKKDERLIYYLKIDKI